ncbi:MAG: EscT/YscT/HrcT family type III secretion system export apparatus protein [Chitinivibrionales bacterium]|nr:EscT/YscT/HrcT family type III secretion system export apparatus protein [Chitinivibrionales bacterium]MBD3356599.1 EscT/YscT/HrcT family type III secretion system export apparatus protein [Chitinivibrionales bacterium]
MPVVEAYEALLGNIGAVLPRFAGFFLVFPLFGSNMLPKFVQRAIMIGMTVVLFPLVASQPVPSFDPMLKIAVVIKEALLGVAMGFLAGLPFWTAEGVGAVVDNQRGSSAATLFDPIQSTQTTPLGSMLFNLIIMLFFISGGFRAMLAGLYETYRIWPVNSFFPRLHDYALQLFVQKSSQYLGTIVLLASPILITMFLITIGMGLINRFAPRLNVFILSMPIKSAAAVFLLIVCMGGFFVLFERDFADLADLFRLLDGVFR